MRHLVLILTGAALVSACAPQPYETMPVSAYQWQQRQERIEREEAQRQARCEALRTTDRQKYARECMRAVETPQ